MSEQTQIKLEKLVHLHDGGLMRSAHDHLDPHFEPINAIPVGVPFIVVYEHQTKTRESEVDIIRKEEFGHYKALADKVNAYFWGATCSVPGHPELESAAVQLYRIEE